MFRTDLRPGLLGCQLVTASAGAAILLTQLAGPGTALAQTQPGYTVINGQNTIPFSWFALSHTPYNEALGDTPLTESQQHGFTSVMPYAPFDSTNAEVLGYLDRAQALGVKVMVSVQGYSGLDLTNKVNLVKNHPAVYGYYLEDEPDIRGVTPAQLQARYNDLKALDTNPSHPAFVSFATPIPSAAAYLPATDVVIRELYPESNLAQVRLDVQATRNAGKAGYLAAPRAFQDPGYGIYPSDYGFRYSVYSPMSLGASGIMPFIFEGFVPDAYDIPPVGSRDAAVYPTTDQLRSIVPTLLKGTAGLTASSPQANVPVGSGYDPNLPKISYTFAGDPNDAVLITANNSGGTMSNINFSVLGLDPSITSAQVLGENRTISLTAGSFVDNFVGEKSVHVYRFGTATTTWQIPSSGNWNTGNNWNTGVVPNGVGSVAILGGAISSVQTVYSNLAVTVGTLKFDNANKYVVGGSGSLKIEVASGSGSVSVLQGSHKINLPLTFASNTNVSIASGATLTLGNPTTINAGKTVTKNGNLLIQAPLKIQAGGALVNGTGAMSLLGAPSLGVGAKIDLTNTGMTIDYAGQASPAGTVKAQLTTGYASGAWNGEGINTSSAVANQTGLGWKDDAASQSILVKYTYYGDANLDGQVDISDLGALATAWQTSAVWSQGDFDYSGFVDISDLGKLATNWQLGVGSPLGPSFDEALASVGLAGVSVPEPAGLSIIGLVALAFRRRRR